MNAQVVAKDGQQLVVRTQGGNILVLANNPKLADFLNQAALTLKFPPNALAGGNAAGAMVTTANGIVLQPPLAVLLQSPSAAQLALAAPPAAPNPAPSLPQPGQTLAAQVLPEANAGGAAPGINAAAALPVGAQAQFALKAAALPGQPLPAAVLAQLDQVAKAAPQQSAQPALPGAGQLLAGVSAGANAAGQTLLRTPQGLLALDLPQALPAGAQVVMELTGLMRPIAANSGLLATSAYAAQPGAVLQRLEGGWPLLQQTLDAVRALDPALAQKLLDRLPQPNARLASNALQFMAASALGQAEAFLGADAVKLLRQSGRGDLVAKLDDDFKDLAKLNQRGSDTDWQALTMPMLVQGKVEPVQIFMRRRKDKKKQQSQTRFIVDFNLESTGAIQFDGFIGGRQLDLIMRSESDFGPAFKLDVQKIFDDALGLTGMSGSLRFAEREKPIPWPIPEAHGSGPSVARIEA